VNHEVIELQKKNYVQQIALRFISKYFLSWFVLWVRYWITVWFDFFHWEQFNNLKISIQKWNEKDK